MKTWNDPEATWEDDVQPMLKAWEGYAANGTVIVSKKVIGVLDERWPHWRDDIDTTRWHVKD